MFHSSFCILGTSSPLPPQPLPQQDHLQPQFWHGLYLDRSRLGNLHVDQYGKPFARTKDMHHWDHCSAARKQMGKVNRWTSSSVRQQLYGLPFLSSMFLAYLRNARWVGCIWLMWLSFSFSINQLLIENQIGGNPRGSFVIFADWFGATYTHTAWS